MIPDHIRSIFRRGKAQTEKTILDYYDSESSAATEFRRLARNVRYRGNPEEIRSILVTSAAKHEGKSLVASNLAIAMAKRESDKQIMLMDCDMRRPVIHSLFGIEREPGFADLLNGTAEVGQAAHDTQLPNLKVVPTGTGVDSPLHLLPGAKDVLVECKNLFNIVVCDAPPIIPVDDAAILGPHVDGALLVVLAGKTDRVVVKRAMEVLNEAKVEILGTVLNNLHGTLPYYYDYKYYRYNDRY